MLNEITAKQRELDEMRQAFHGLRTFSLELRRRTKGKNFHVVNSFAWDSVLACRRMLVVDLAAWVDSLLPPRPPKPGHHGWLSEHLTAISLPNLRAKYHPEALRRVFGQAAVRRGQATEQEVERLKKHIFCWATNLRRLRNAQAHRFGTTTGNVKALRHADLAKRILRCSSLMADLRLLADSSSFPLAPIHVSQSDATARDLVDVIVVGTISFAVDQWSKEPGATMRQQRDAYYARLHGRRRRKTTDPFNTR